MPKKSSKSPPPLQRAARATVPAAIRKMLALGKRDQVVFGGLADGTVVIAKKETCADGDDPVIGKFLEFVARDMMHEPARIRPVPRSLVSRAKALAKGVEADVDAPLPDDEA
jgi:antitoxin PrlF